MAARNRRKRRKSSSVDSIASKYNALEDRRMLAADLANLGYGLNQIVTEFEAFQSGQTQQLVFSNADNYHFNGESIFVEVRTTANEFLSLRNTLQTVGFSETVAAPGDGILEGYMPIGELAAIAELNISVSINPILNISPTDGQGSVNPNEAEQAQFSAFLSQLTNVNGAGIIIGVISDSANQVGAGLSASQLTGDLPNVPQVQILIPGPAGSVDEGRAMMELIYDIAPGAQLRFASGVGGDAGMANAINTLVAAGANVIVDDLNGLSSEPYFQDGLAAQAVEAAVTAGVTYFSSNGNRGDSGYNSATRFEATTVAGMAGNWHDFNQSNDYTQSITVSGPGTIFFQFDQSWGSIASDVDFFLLNAAGNAVVDSGTLVNTATQLSQEFVVVPAAGTFQVAVRLFAGPAPSRFQWISIPSLTINEHLSTPGAINTATNPTHNGAVSSISVAAANYLSPTVPESFTSQGVVVRTLSPTGTPIPMEVRNKPVVTGIDGVNNSFFGSDSDADGNPNFFGTSAAAPNVAAMAALLRQLVPTFSSAQIRQSLINGATDMLTPGYDLTTGFGLVQGVNASLDATLGVLTIPGDRIGATINDVYVVNRNPLNPANFFDVTLNGTLLGTVLTSLVNNLVLTGLSGSDQFIFNDNLASTFPAITINGGAGTDTLVINDGSINQFAITSADGGTVDTNITFTSTETLTGGSNIDNFVFGALGSLTGAINGGAGIDTIDYSIANFGSLQYTLNGVNANGFNSLAPIFTGIDILTGSILGNTDALTGLNQNATWQLNQVLYTTGGQTLVLNNFDVLNGGSAVDTFNVRMTNQPFTINGGGGNDVFNLSSLAPSTNGNLNGIVGQLTIDGGTGANTLTMSDAGGTPNVATVFNTAINGMTVLPVNYAATGGTFTVNLIGSGLGDDAFTVTSFLAGNTLNLSGMNGADSFTVQTAALGTINMNGNSGVDSYVVNMSGANRTVNITENGGDNGDSLMAFGTNGNNTISVGPGLLTMANETVTYQFLESVVVNGLAGVDRFRLLPGASNVSLIGGNGRDLLVGQNTATTYALTGSRMGQIAALAISFSELERINAGNAADTFVLATSAINMVIAGGAGTDTLIGPNANRVWKLTGANRGFLAASFVNWAQVENLTGGNMADRFDFSNSGSVSGIVEGNAGRDTLNYSARNTAVSVVLTSLGAAGANEFNGTATAIGGGFRNINILTGSSTATGDSLKGMNVNSNWIYQQVGSRYRVGANRLVFNGIESLIGGSMRDYFKVFPSATTALTINGGPPISIPGDTLKIEFAGVVNPQWMFGGDRAGTFTFDNRMPVVYSDIEVLDVFDFGDAAGSFGTLLAQNGARHRLGTTLRLGTRLDPEGNGQPTGNATGDDVTGTPDDEDGVVLPGVLIPHFRAATIVNSTGAGFLDAWVDYNRDGIFSSSEKIANSVAVTAGSNRIEFEVPFGVAVGGSTTARFRLSSSGGLSPTGIATDGEVEDHNISIASIANGTYAVLPDPFAPGTGDTILVMAGTGGNDTIVVNPDSEGNLIVRINGGSVGPPIFSAVTRIGSYGLAGNDSIIVTSTMSQQSELYGDSGNDDLFGGASADLIRGGTGNDELYGHDGHDMLFGENGRDSLFGHAGNDILGGGQGDDLFGGGGIDLLFGGTGADSLYGQTDGDLLVGNWTIYETNFDALAMFRQEWTSTRSYGTRVNNIVNGTGPVLGGTGLQLLTGTTVLDDNAADRYFGGEDRDLFISLFAGDQINDHQAGEFVR